MKFKWWRFGAYLAVGLFVFGTWATYNYSTYVAQEQEAEKEIAVNVAMIEETVNEINVEQRELRMVQEVYREPPAMSMEMESPRSGYGGMTEAAPAPPAARAPASVDPVEIELQARIDSLEAEKEELLQEKHYIKQAILDSVSVFKGVKVDNPLVNAIIIPIFLYIMKKLLDFGFRRLEDWYEEKHAVHHISK